VSAGVGRMGWWAAGGEWGGGHLPRRVLQRAHPSGLWLQRPC